MIARKRNPSEIGSFDESARLIHYFSLIFFALSYFLSLIQQQNLPHSLKDLHKGFALRLKNACGSIYP
nr:hypothetical protein CFP56_44555 [Quercus suber]